MADAASTATSNVVRRVAKGTNPDRVPRRRVTYDASLIGSAVNTPRAGGATPTSRDPVKKASGGMGFSRQTSVQAQPSPSNMGAAASSFSRAITVGDPEAVLVTRSTARRKTTTAVGLDPLDRVAKAAAAASRGRSVSKTQPKAEGDESRTGSKERAGSKGSKLGEDPELVMQAMSRRICKAVEMDVKDVTRILVVFQEEAAKLSGPIVISVFRQCMRRIAPGRDLNENSVQQGWSLSKGKKDAAVSFGEVDMMAFCNYWSQEEKWAHLKAAVAWKATDEAIMELAVERDVDVVTIEKTKGVFDSFDDNGSGIMDFVEFGEALKELLKLEEDPGEELVGKQWKLLDQDDAGEVDFPDFARWYLTTFDIATGEAKVPVV
mmetsp:Transcript_8962/g.19754  ORF Transcript_8962/g.19754 Transcript_8962/m.19754 type:complete len:378 (+) Transcript_8962:66-1199(+)